MVVQGKNALANLLNGADPPSEGPLVKKDDDGGFDVALGMALFAYPPFVAPPNPTTNGAPDKGALADKTSVLAAPSPSGGDNALQVTDYGVRQSLAQNLPTDNGDTAGSRSAAAAPTVSFEDLVASLPTDGSAPLAAHSGERQTPAFDLAAGDSPSPSAAVSVSFQRFGGSSGSAEPADDPHGLPASDSKPLDDSHGLPVGDLKPMDDSRGLPVGDPNPSDDARGLPVGDPGPSISESNNPPQSTTGDIPASAPREGGHVIRSKAPDDSVLNLTGSSAPTFRARERAPHAEGPATQASAGSQPKTAASRANAPVAGSGPDANRLAGQPVAGASDRQIVPRSEGQSKATVSNPIPNSIDPSNRTVPSDSDKHNPALRTDSALPASHRSGADDGVTPATTSVPDGRGGGASRPTASAAPTLRTIATPAPGAKIANLRIDLAAGQTTHATVRERSGAVDVRIVAADQQSAQLIGSEIPSLRRALDAAGMQLKTADVQRQGGGERRQDERQQQPERRWRSGQSGDGSIFAIEEVKQ